ncbi:MAG TPA: phosphoglucomutase, partial [Firmicutes bacterium]|nr:phosphoglucomutase [Bacillota bacterium]
VRDKDGIQAILLYCEMALHYYRQGIPLDVAYDNLEKKYGYHSSQTLSVYFEGEKGHADMIALLEHVHSCPLKEVYGKRIVWIEDYETSISKNVITGEEKPIALEKSNVIRYLFEDSSWIAIRPSGTEPKCKFYLEVFQKEKKGIEEAAKGMMDSLKEQLHLK